MKHKFSLAMSLALILTMALTSLAFAGPSAIPASQSSTPTIASDLPDYGPGETVNLFGAGWQDGESVHIFVNDNVGSSWSRSADVVAADDGTFTDTFQLPSWFVATYSVTATGATSGTATTTFTDGNLKFNDIGLPSGTSWTIVWDGNSQTAISPLDPTFGGSEHTANYTVTSPISGGAGVQFVASPSSGSATRPQSNTTTVNITFTKQYQVSFAVSPSGSGSTTPSTTAYYNAGSIVAISATPSAGYAFSSWSATGSITFANASSASTNATIGGPGTITANFVLSDTTPPTINCTVPNQTIWYGSNVTVNCTASDSGSGLANPADASFSLSTSVSSGTETASASTGSQTVFDNAGNSATAGPFTFKVDKKAPSFSCGSADGIWHASDVSIACTGSDGGSGLATPASFSLITNVPASTEDANASTGTAAVTDNVGNSTTAGPISGNKVDKKAPTVLCGSADGLWHGSDVSIACTASDGGSGLANPADASFSLSTNVPAGTEDANASTGSHAVADAVGNSITAGPISGNMIDRKAPSVLCGSADGLWHASDVSIACTASDGGSGLANLADASFSLSTNVPAGTEDANASTGTHAVPDAVGNSATAGPISGNKVDKKAPSITITAPTATTYILNQAVVANFTCNDGGSGLATCVGTVANGSNIDTASTGSKPFIVNATDNVGNSSNASLNYNVKFALCVLYDQTKSHKSGSTVPLKLQLCDANGVNYSSASIVVKATSITKLDNSAGALDDSGAANSPDLNFRYDATLGGSGGYIFNLSTKGLTTGTWKVTFTVNGASDPSYFVRFDVK